MRRAVIALLLLSACIVRVPVQRQASPLPVAVGVWLDASAAIPERVSRHLTAQLDERNLPVSWATPDATTPRAARHAAVVKAFPDAALHVAVELRATFFSHLNGRYRWTVLGQVTMSRGTATAVVERFELPALLDFEREGEVEAIAQVAEGIAKRVGTVADAVLATPPAPPAGKAAKREADFIYFAMVDRFANGDKSNDADVDANSPLGYAGGDLAGLEQKLDWLAGLGVRTVWLSPIFAMRTAPYHGYPAWHGYWTYDWDRIEARFGDEAALKQFTDAAHQRGMRVLLDFVVNHVGPDSPWVKERPNWFHHLGGVTDWNDPTQMVNHDVHGLPDLAQENPEVYAYLLKAAKRWAPLVDGYRLDAVKHAPLGFWARFNTDLAQTFGPKFELLGELLDGNPQTLAKTQGDGRFTGLFDFPLHGALNDVFCHGAPPLKLASVLANDRLYPDAQALVTLLDNHDLSRLASTCKSDARKIDEAITALFFMRGVPSIIWGTEIMLPGERDPLNRAPMRFVAHPLQKTIAALAATRAASPALLQGVTRVLEVSDDRLALVRQHGDSTALLLVNHSGEAYAPPRVSELGLRSWKAVDGLESGKVAAAPQSTALFTATGPTAQWVPVNLAVRFEWNQKSPPEGIKIVGSAPELGSWNVAQAPSLIQGFADVELPENTVVEYKLVKAVSGRPVEWQGGSNRWFQVSRANNRVAVSWE
jgi:glycosidase